MALTVFFGALLTPQHVWAKTEQTKQSKKKAKKQKHRRVPAAVVDPSAAYADIVIDAETGEIYHATNADSQRHPASLTKMMTLYLTFQALEKGRLNINQYLPISDNAAQQPPTKLGLRAGQRIRVEDAVLGLVTESANDAAMVLGEWLGGSEESFAAMMTRQARALGMTRTTFQNPTGLPNPDQVTTARDMAVLGQSLLDHFPRYYPYFSRTGFVYKGINRPNHNRLMSRYEGMDGIKTGYIRASGFNLVASVKRGDTRLIGVVFGGKSAKSRDNRMAEILDAVFDTTEDTDDSDSAAPRLAKPLPSTNKYEDVMLDHYVPSTPSTYAKDAYVTLPKPVAPMTKPAPAAPTPARGNEISSDSWGVQIGAYASPQAAQASLGSLAQSMPQLLGSAKPIIEPVIAGKVTMYRARLMGVDPKTAQAVCTYMLTNKRSCLTVGP